ncbi:MAG: hypothetical protein AAFV78_12645 [Bacteroidota bacterium]
MPVNIAPTAFVSAAEAVSHDRVFVHGVGMTPHTLIQALCERRFYLQDGAQVYLSIF